jgi:hypothetical protein
MKWFRSNIRHGSLTALFALTIQFALSFGHFHGVVAAPAAQSGLTHLQAATASEAVDRFKTSLSEPQSPASNRDSDPSSTDPCAVCAVIAMSNTVLSATPPLLPQPVAVALPYSGTEAEFVDLNSAPVAFQPRAPPIS